MKKEDIENNWAGVELADSIWEDHIAVFESFDLQSTNGNSLKNETASNALFHALITLDKMRELTHSSTETAQYIEATAYLQKSKYYSEENKDSDF